MKRAGVAGWPVGHSRSPALHNFWLKAHHIEAEYVRLPIEPKDLVERLKTLPNEGFVGINLTIPHKEEAYRYCKALGVVDEAAQKIGAVNTLVFEDGKIARAMNTDGYGFIENIKSHVPEWKPEETGAVVLGAGGAARGIVAALEEEGVPCIRLLNRTREKAVQLAENFSNVTVGDWENPAQSLANATLLINTTSLGMKGEPPLKLPLNDLSKNAIVADIVYTPLQTDLLKNATARGNKTVDGLGMLLYQAVPAFEAWFGVKPEVTQALRKCVLEA